jgi:hypothetical protein
MMARSLPGDGPRSRGVDFVTGVDPWESTSSRGSIPGSRLRHGGRSRGGDFVMEVDPGESTSSRGSIPGSRLRHGGRSLGVDFVEEVDPWESTSSRGSIPRSRLRHGGRSRGVDFVTGVDPWESTSSRGSIPGSRLRHGGRSRGVDFVTGVDPGESTSSRGSIPRSRLRHGGRSRGVDFVTGVDPGELEDTYRVRKGAHWRKRSRNSARWTAIENRFRWGERADCTCRYGRLGEPLKNLRLREGRSKALYTILPFSERPPLPLQGRRCQIKSGATLPAQILRDLAAVRERCLCGILFQTQRSGSLCTIILFLL